MKEKKIKQQRIYNNKGVNTLSWALYHSLPYCIYTKLLPLSLKKDSTTPKTKTNWWTKIIDRLIMGYPRNFRKGSKAEYLTQVYMTSLGFSNPTYRQEDFGIDFTCVLTEEINKQLYPIEPFNLQVKANKYKDDQVLKFKKDNPQDLDWLFKNPNPYFLAWVDVDKTKSIYFYSLSSLWFLDITKSTYKSLIFKYDTNITIDTENINDYKPNAVISDNHITNLGKPFMTMTLDDIKDESALKKKWEILNYMIKFEKENIQYRSLNLPFFKWLWKYKTNDLNSFITGWGHFCNNDVFKEINNPIEIIKNIGNILITLTSSFVLNNPKGENEEYTKHYYSLLELLKLLPLNDNGYKGILTDMGYMDNNGNFINKNIEFPKTESLCLTGETLYNATIKTDETQLINLTSKPIKNTRMGDFKEPHNKKKNRK